MDAPQHHTLMSAYSHEGHPPSHKLLWYTGALTAAITLSPYLLPAIGIGNELTQIETTNLLHMHEGGYGTGLAGWLNQGLGALPMVGTMLASGSWAPIIASAVLGIGGVLLANYLEKRETPETRIPWSKIIKAAAITSSILVALPSILTGISTGLTYMALAGGDKGVFIDQLYQTIGITAHGGTGGAAGALLPHVLLCGASIIPATLSYWMGTRNHTPSTEIGPEREHLGKTSYNYRESAALAAFK